MKIQVKENGILPARPRGSDDGATTPMWMRYNSLKGVEEMVGARAMEEGLEDGRRTAGKRMTMGGSEGRWRCGEQQAKATIGGGRGVARAVLPWAAAQGKKLPHFTSPSCLPSLPFFSGHFTSLSRRSNILSLLFQHLHLNNSQPSSLSRASLLSLTELLSLLRRFKSLAADLSSSSRIRLLLTSDSISARFHELTSDLSTLLDILPLSHLPITDDVRDLTDLVRRQCRRSTPDPDPDEDRTRSEMLDLIREIELQNAPELEKLERVFEKLGLGDSRSCGAEIECLEREIGDGVCGKWSSAMISLVGLVRYGKCVLFGASTPRSEPVSEFGSAAGSSDLAVPADFRCPISLELMTDPVVVSSGQTYDRESIARWIASGHATCPKSGQALLHSNLVPNRALKNLIALWCREQNIPFDSPSSGNGETVGAAPNKAALEAARMTALFLVKELSASSAESTNRVVHELRQLAKTGSENRAFIGDAGAVPLLVPLLSSAEESLQINAVTALLNLSILEANKKRVMHADGAVGGIVHVLTEGATWQAKENAAATILSLSAVHSYRRRLGRNHRILAALISLARVGPVRTKKDALAAILSLAGERENIRRLIDAEVIEAALEVIGVADVAEEAVGIIAAVAKRGGAQEVGAKSGVVMKLVRVLKNGSDSGRESAASALVILCRKVGGSEAVGDLVRVPGIECVIWELMGSGTERGRRKAAALGRVCRRWVAAAEEAERAARFSAAMSVSASTLAQA